MFEFFILISKLYNIFTTLLITTFIINFRSLAVGSKNGYSLYNLGSVDTLLEEIYSSHSEEICLVERLFSSSLVAVVSINSPRKLKVNFNY